MLVKIRIDLESQDAVPPGFVGKRMYLIPVDKINISGLQMILFLFQKKCHCSLKNHSKFKIIMSMGTAGGHFNNKNLQMIHCSMSYNFHFFLFHRTVSSLF